MRLADFTHLVARLLLVLHAAVPALALVGPSSWLRPWQIDWPSPVPKSFHSGKDRRLEARSRRLKHDCEHVPPLFTASRGESTVYMFGTYHLPTSYMYPNGFPPVVRSALANSSRFYGEIDFMADAVPPGADCSAEFCKSAPPLNSSDCYHWAVEKNLSTVADLLSRFDLKRLYDGFMQNSLYTESFSMNLNKYLEVHHKEWNCASTWKGASVLEPGKCDDWDLLKASYKRYLDVDLTMASADLMHTYFYELTMKPGSHPFMVVRSLYQLMDPRFREGQVAFSRTGGWCPDSTVDIGLDEKLACQPHAVESGGLESSKRCDFLGNPEEFIASLVDFLPFLEYCVIVPGYCQNMVQEGFQSVAMEFVCGDLKESVRYLSTEDANPVNFARNREMVDAVLSVAAAHPVESIFAFVGQMHLLGEFPSMLDMMCTDGYNVIETATGETYCSGSKMPIMVNMSVKQHCNEMDECPVAALTMEGTVRIESGISNKSHGGSTRTVACSFALMGVVEPECECALWGAVEPGQCKDVTSAFGIPLGGYEEAKVLHLGCDLNLSFFASMVDCKNWLTGNTMWPQEPPFGTLGAPIMEPVDMQRGCSKIQFTPGPQRPDATYRMTVEDDDTVKCDGAAAVPTPPPASDEASEFRCAAFFCDVFAYSANDDFESATLFEASSLDTCKRSCKLRDKCSSVSWFAKNPNDRANSEMQCVRWFEGRCDVQDGLPKGYVGRSFSERAHDATCTKYPLMPTTAPTAPKTGRKRRRRNKIDQRKNKRKTSTRNKKRKHKKRKKRRRQ